MRFILPLLSLAQLSGALLEAIPSEMKAWYDAYLIERLVYKSPGSWKIAVDCRHRTYESNADFDASADAVGLPVALTCTFDEFVRHIGFRNSFGQWQSKNPAVFDYNPVDALEEVRRLRKLGAVNPHVKQWALLDDPSTAEGSKFDMTKIQDLIEDIAEKARTEVASDPKKAGHVEAWIKDRIQNLETANDFRRSDQSRFKKPWAGKDIKYGGSNKYPLLTKPEKVTLPDGTTPPTSTWPEDKHLEAWSEPDWDRTLAQGGDSAIAQSSRKETRKLIRKYGEWAGDKDPDKQKATEHVSIIKKNQATMQRHAKPPAASCSKKRRIAFVEDDELPVLLYTTSA